MQISRTAYRLAPVYMDRSIHPSFWQWSLSLLSTRPHFSSHPNPRIVGTDQVGDSETSIEGQKHQIQGGEYCTLRQRRCKQQMEIEVVKDGKPAVAEVVLYTDKTYWHKARRFRHLNEFRKHKNAWYK